MGGIDEEEADEMVSGPALLSFLTMVGLVRQIWDWKKSGVARERT